jgi:hypothetical protein
MRVCAHSRLVQQAWWAGDAMTLPANYVFVLLCPAGCTGYRRLECEHHSLTRQWPAGVRLHSDCWHVSGSLLCLGCAALVLLHAAAAHVVPFGCHQKFWSRTSHGFALKCMCVLRVESRANAGPATSPGNSFNVTLPPGVTPTGDVEAGTNTPAGAAWQVQQAGVHSSRCCFAELPESPCCVATCVSVRLVCCS